MSAELDALWRLRELDEESIAISARLRELPALRVEVGRREAASHSELEAHRQRATALQVARRKLEKDIEALAVEERKFQSQLQAVKKNEEYQALLHEIASVRSRRSDLETDVLTRMEAEDAASTERPALEKLQAELLSADATQLAEWEARERDGGERLAALEAMRSAPLGSLDAVTRSRYERLRASREGRAVVAVTKNACGGCFRSLPPQMLQEARRRDRLLTCEGCGRLLVWPPDDSPGSLTG